MQRRPRGSVRITVAIFDSSASHRVFTFSALKAMASDKVPRCPAGGADGGHEFHKGGTHWLSTVDMIVTDCQMFPRRYLCNITGAKGSAIENRESACGSLAGTVP